MASTPTPIAREPMRDALRDSVRGEAEGRRGSPVAGRPADPEVFQILDKANNAFAAQRLQDAVGYYQAALEADGRRGELDEVQKSLIFERMGTAYRQMGLAGEASRALRRAVAQAPQNSAAHYQLSLCMAMDGRIADSLGELNKALDSASTIEDLRKIMLMAKTDPELEGVRDMPKFAELLRSHSSKLSARR